jgi:hypothetical protein
MPPAVMIPKGFDIDLTKFPYFEDGDVIISLSPCERQLVLHSLILADAFSAFKRSVNEATRQRYELVCNSAGEIEGEQTSLFGKVGFQSSSMMSIMH